MNSPEPACAIPDLGPDVYARWRASEIGAITERLERQLILELVADFSGCRVLDIGCGDGELAIELTKRGAMVTGIDASAAMVEAAKERAKRHNVDIVFQVATAERLPFSSGQFDIVTAINGNEVNDLISFYEIVADPDLKEWTFSVLRDGEKIDVTVVR